MNDTPMPVTKSNVHRLQNGFIQLHAQHGENIRQELAEGLAHQNAYTSAKYLYDGLGSKLFESICEVPEYYPTRTEASIFAINSSAIAESVGLGSTFIDLGAGNCAKAAGLFAYLKPAQYVPIDISVDFLRDTVATLHQRFPDIDMLGIGMDFSGSLDLPPQVNAGRRLFFYPGSSIGNYSPTDALAYLQRIRSSCGATLSPVAEKTHAENKGGLLIGVDLVKDHALLNAAYDDALGVTAAFNLNLLLHLNKLLEADFVVRDWQHHAFFNAEKSRIEMHLEARSAVEVSWSGGHRRFESGERIHTESSYKYTRQSFASLLERAGFQLRHQWTDANDWFMVCHAVVA
jgi:dimethylhistidine N-methyltransferase